MMPAAAGPIALKSDIAVMAIPLAAPLWSCLCIVKIQKHVSFIFGFT